MPSLVGLQTDLREVGIEADFTVVSLGPTAAETSRTDAADTGNIRENGQYIYLDSSGPVASMSTMRAFSRSIIFSQEACSISIVVRRALCLLCLHSAVQFERVERVSPLVSIVGLQNQFEQALVATECG